MDKRLFSEGMTLRPQHIGVLAMLGVAFVPVRRKPRVVLVSNGYELLRVDVPLVPGKTCDSKTYILTALV